MATQSSPSDMSDKVAIIGYACRLPGQVSTADDLWELCTRRRTGWSEIPKDRFSLDRYWHPNPSKLGTSNAKGGYFLDQDITKFDASFFSFTQKEAISLDPQQRLLLECTFEALENAGISKEQFAGKNVGVYVGANLVDYDVRNAKDTETSPMHQATGCAPAMQSNRISYIFDLRGPSMTFDTACSGGLVALHHAVRSVRSGESSAAIIGGCRLNLAPDYYITMSLSQLFNEMGKTAAFDEKADSGFARGEGSGVVIIKPLEAALRDGDQIRAVITNTGVNQDGRTQGITNPNGEAQCDLIKQVYAEAGVDPRECGYAEMHGTGTKVGDPIEASAIHGALSVHRSPSDPLYVGSVKSNVGHLEGASGLVSIIKASMMLEKQLVLPTANFKKANPAIPLKDWNMRVLTSTRPFPPTKKYVSVSNYGFGGTNAHALLEMPPMEARNRSRAVKGDPIDPPQKLFFFSANDKEALQCRLRDLSVYFEQRPEAFEKYLFGDVAYTLGCRRSHLPYRLALAASSLSDLGNKIAQARLTSNRVTGQPKMTFVFTGQGAQWAKMGVDLMATHPVFAAAITRADDHIRSLGADFSLVEELQRDNETTCVNQPRISQPACTAVQIGLVQLLKTWGMEPSYVVGHSSGEIAAAYAAGAYDADAAMALAYYRGDVTNKMKTQFPEIKGGMIAVGLGPEAAKNYIAKVSSGYLTVACVNSPTSVTVSGDEPAVAELHQILDAEKIFNRQLKVDVAYHSQHLACVSEIYLSSISALLPAPSLKARFYSSVYGRVVEGSELGAQYWVENLLNTVQFSDAVRAMCSDDAKPDLLIELGPHCALKGPVRDILKSCGSSASKIAYSSTLIRGADAGESVLEAAAAAFTKGATLDFLNVNFPITQARHTKLATDIPRYPWQYTTRFWHDSRIATQYTKRPGKRNDVLGIAADYSNELEPTWRNIVRLDDVPWLRHHKMQGMPVFPLAGYLAMAIEASQQRADARGLSFDNFELREVNVGSALVLNDGVDTETMITLRPWTDASRGQSDVWDEFKIYSWDIQRGWAEHCRGLVRVVDSEKQNANAVTSSVVNAAEALRTFSQKIETQATQKIDGKHMYRILDEIGASYGPTFQGIDYCHSSADHAFGDIYVQDTQSLMPKGYEPELVIHPSFLDIFVQVAWPILGAGRIQFDTLFMPTRVGQMRISRDIVKTPGDRLSVWCHGDVDRSSPQPATFHYWAAKPGEPGSPLIKVDNFVMTPIRDAGGSSASQIRNVCYKLVTTRFEFEGSDSTEDEKAVVESDKVTSAPIAVEAVPAETTPVEVTSVEQPKPAKASVDIINVQVIDGVKTSVEIVNVEIGSDGTTTPEIVSDGTTTPEIISDGRTTPEIINNDEVVIEKGSGPSGHGIPELIDTGSDSQLTDSEISSVGESDIAIVQFGDSDRLSTDLAQSLVISTGARPSMHQLEDTDYSQKRVVILQSGSKSLRNVKSEEFQCLKKILLNAVQVMWVLPKDAPESSMSIGLARSVRSENLSKIITLTVKSSDLASPSSPARSVMKAMQSLWFKEPAQPVKDMEFSSVDGQLFVQRLEEDNSMNSFVSNETGAAVFEKQSFAQAGRRLKIEIEKYSALDTIRWVDDAPAPLGDDQVEVKVEATGVNFKDIVVCMGQVSQPYIGVECSGVVAAVGKNVSHVQVGQRVMAMVEGAYSTYARCLGTSAWPIEDSMSFEEAATIPVVFCTAYYGLFDLGRLAEGERVLIHAAAGGVGQAAIMLAKMAGAEIFATVGSPAKKKFIMERYSIPEDRIFYSRDISFGADIRRATNGAGVDVVLNSLAGDILRETWDCLAPFGRFVEIGKADIVRNSRLDMLKFEYNCTFASVDLTKVAAFKPKLMKRILSDVAALLQKGTISAIGPITVYSIAETEQAFRSLQSGKAMGKLVVVPKATDQVTASAPKLNGDLFRADATYVLIGGTGGLGRSMAKWMSVKGARHIVLVSRSASINAKTQALIDELATSETQVIVRPCDVANLESATKLIKEDLASLPPVRGLVHGAMVLKDMLYEQMNLEDFNTVTACKVDGALNLHEALADSPLDFFIALSSVAGVVGNRGQAAYAAANVFLDEFMHYRRSQGLPGTSIDLAAVSNVGYLADGSEERRQEVLKNIGGSTIDEAEVLALLAGAVTGKVDSTCGGQVVTGFGGSADAEAFWLSDGKFTTLRERIEAESAGGASGSGPSAALSTTLRTAPSKGEATETLTAALMVKLAAVLVIPEDSIEPSHTLKSLGLDSLVAIEIRNWIARETEVNVQVLELLSSGSITNLAELILKKMGL